MKNIVETLKGLKECSTFFSMVDATDLKKKLSGKEEYTLFAPTNLGCECIDKGLKKSGLQDIVKYHVIKGRLKSIDLIPYKLRETLQGTEVCLEAERVQINASLIIQKDIECTNGYIHIIDTIIAPKEVSCEPATNYANYEKDNCNC
ncbi:MAG: fasciclin domain-containing protein [Nanoarchaeota archaeon]|nr:fasciclin domain-containing protein [Nanoarchaeota archaeon]